MGSQGAHRLAGLRARANPLRGPLVRRRHRHARPANVDPMEALDKAFAKLREIVVSEQPHISYFTIDLRVASSTPVPHPR